MNPIYKPNAEIVVSVGSSLRFGERCTRTQTERGEINMMERRAMLFPRGSFGVGRYAGFRVVEATITEERGGIGVLQINWEVNPDFGGPTVTSLPADGFELKPFDINPPVHQHPRYSGLTPLHYDLVKLATDGSDELSREEALLRLNLSAVDDPAAAASVELVKKLRAGIQTYYLTGLEYAWWSYFWAYPTITIGGKVEIPSGPGADKLPPGGSCLRLTDVPTREDGYYKLTRTWKCAPNGHWDPDLYS